MSIGTVVLAGPAQHRSTEAEAGRSPCSMDVGLFGITFGTVPIGGLFPEWVPVQDLHNPAVLEGEVVAREGPYPGHGLFRKNLYPLRGSAYADCSQLNARRMITPPIWK
jgi:hypothetical protein